MNQLDLNVKTAAVIDAAENGLRVLVMAAAREVMANQSIENELIIMLEDGIRCELQPKIGSILVGGQPSGNLFVLTQIIEGLHKLLGANPNTLSVPVAEGNSQASDSLVADSSAEHPIETSIS